MITSRCLASVADNVKVIMKTKYNISSVFSAEKLNGNSAKQPLWPIIHKKQIVMEQLKQKTYRFLP
jgi:hypothetical protein